MKNYKFVLGLLLSSTIACGVQAASIAPNTDANRAVSPASGGGAVALQNANSHQLLLNRAAAPPSVTTPMLPVTNFMKDATLAKAFHYLDGSGDATQGLRAQTKLAQATALAEDVSEPASEILLLAGLSALAIAVRRQAKS